MSGRTNDLMAGVSSTGRRFHNIDNSCYYYNHIIVIIRALLHQTDLSWVCWASRVARQVLRVQRAGGTTPQVPRKRERERAFDLRVHAEMHFLQRQTQWDTSVHVYTTVARRYHLFVCPRREYDHKMLLLRY